MPLQQQSLYIYANARKHPTAYDPILNKATTANWIYSLCAIISPIHGSAIEGLTAIDIVLSAPIFDVYKLITFTKNEIYHFQLGRWKVYS